MTQYVATINVPGYLPMDDDPPVFDTPHEAWSYLAGERERGEDDCPDWHPGRWSAEYSPTRETLAVLGTAAHWQEGATTDTRRARAEWLAEHGLEPDGTGTVYGDTPGYDGDHDLGLAYSVTEYDPCPRCGGDHDRIDRREPCPTSHTDHRPPYVTE